MCCANHFLGNWARSCAELMNMLVCLRSGLGSEAQAIRRGEGGCRPCSLCCIHLCVWERCSQVLHHFGGSSHGGSWVSSPRLEPDSQGQERLPQLPRRHSENAQPSIPERWLPPDLPSPLLPPARCVSTFSKILRLGLERPQPNIERALSLSDSEEGDSLLWLSSLSP